jgi:hypothetical protein
LFTKKNVQMEKEGNYMSHTHTYFSHVTKTKHTYIVITNAQHIDLFPFFDKKCQSYIFKLIDYSIISQLLN